MLYFLQNFERPMGSQIIDEFVERRISGNWLSGLTRLERKADYFYLGSDKAPTLLTACVFWYAYQILPALRQQDSIN